MGLARVEPPARRLASACRPPSRGRNGSRCSPPGPNPTAMWQQQMQMMQAFHNDMVMMFQMFVAMHREHLGSVRDELDRVQQLTRELTRLNARLGQLPRSAETSMPSDVGGQRGKCEAVPDGLPRPEGNPRPPRQTAKARTETSRESRQQRARGDQPLHPSRQGTGEIPNDSAPSDEDRGDVRRPDQANHGNPEGTTGLLEEHPQSDQQMIEVLVSCSNPVVIRIATGVNFSRHRSSPVFETGRVKLVRWAGLLALDRGRAGKEATELDDPARQRDDYHQAEADERPLQR